MAGAAGFDVGEFAAAAVFENVGGVDGGALGAVHGDGVPVGQTVGFELVVVEAGEVAVVEADPHGALRGVDVGDGAAFAGDVLAVGAGGEGHDAVAGLVVEAVVDAEDGAGEPALGAHADMGVPVEFFDVDAFVGQHHRLPLPGDVGEPVVDHHVRACRAASAR